MPSVWGSIRKTGFAFAAVSAIAMSHAGATDLLNEPVFEENTTTPVEFGTGWYIRADISGGASLDNNHTGVAAWDGQDEFGLPYSFSIGAGKYITASFRAEVALDRFTGIAANNSNGPCHASINGGDCRFATNAEADAYAISANAYFDFARWGNFRTYVGGGLGVAAVEFSTFNVAGIDSTGNVQVAPNVATEASFEFIGNLQAGATYKLNDKWTFDANYRASYIGSSGFADPTIGATNAGVFNAGDLINHEIRFGLRYDIW